MAESSSKLMSQLMTEVYNLVTKAPAAGDQDKVPDQAKKGGKFSEASTAVHMAMPGIALFEEDFDNLWTPSNPNGLKGQTAAFSVLVDSIPVPGSSKYTQSAKRVSQAYEAILAGANATGPAMSDDVKKMLGKMDKFLYEMKTEPKAPFADDDAKPEPKKVKTAAYQKYEDLIDDIGQAAQDIRTIAGTAGKKADWRADLSDEEIAEIESDGKRLKRVEDRALKLAELYWDEKAGEPLRRHKKLSKEFSGDQDIKYVQQALDYQATHGNELSQALLSNAKELAKLGNWTPTGSDVPVKLAFPSSTKFAQKSNDDGWTEMTTSTKSYHKDKVSKHVNVDAGGSGSWGLWSAKTGGGYDKQSNSESVESKDMSVTMEISLVNIQRPWMDATIFSEYIKWNAGRDQKKGSVSSGNIETQTNNHLLPFIPMQMIVARNVVLTANWSKEEELLVNSKSNSGTSVGWGPFAIKASHVHSDSHFTQDKKNSGSGLSFPGIQCLGFVSWVPPLSAPEDGGATGNEYSLKENPVAAKAAESIVDNMAKPKDERKEITELVAR